MLLNPRRLALLLLPLALAALAAWLLISRGASTPSLGERFDAPDYPASYGDGFGRVNGRVNDLLYVPQTKKLYAAVAQGGVWESTDQAKTWRPIGDTLPIGSTGAVGWTPADGGTLIVATGD